MIEPFAPRSKVCSKPAARGRTGRKCRRVGLGPPPQASTSSNAERRRGGPRPTLHLNVNSIDKQKLVRQQQHLGKLLNAVQFRPFRFRLGQKSDGRFAFF